MSEATAIEIQNAKRVLPMLVDIEGLSVEEVREDIFIVTEHATGNNFSIVVDVEPTTVCLMMEIMDIPEDPGEPLFVELLQLNASAVHGKFCVSDQKIVLRENLQIENLDQNEIEKALEHMFLIVAKSYKDILLHAGIEVDENTFEYDDSDIMEDVADAAFLIAGAMNADAIRESEAQENEKQQEESPVRETVAEESSSFSADSSSSDDSFDSSSDD